MTAEQLNEATRSFTPKVYSDRLRYLDDAWVKYNYDSELADELYGIDQEQSRLLRGKGAGLHRADVDALRAKDSR
jgi:hypothetical protein